MAKEKEQKLPVMPRIRAMEVGDKISLPMSFYNFLSIRSNVYTYGTYTGRKYSAHIDKINKVLEITRES